MLPAPGDCKVVGPAGKVSILDESVVAAGVFFHHLDTARQ